MKISLSCLTVVIGYPKNFRMTSNISIWSFGYGSNMDVKALEAKKHVKVLEHTPAILKDYKMSFNVKALHHVEPAFAGLEEAKGFEVHGVAFCMTSESLEELDNTERGYDKKHVSLFAYDGRKLNGFIYMNKETPKNEELQPSARYLGVLIKGAKQAGLDPDYIEKLSKTPTYKPNNNVLKARSERPDPEDLEEIPYVNLKEYRNRVACLGYVIEPDVIRMESHKGRDITSRALMQFYGIPLDDNDDDGQPPYPLIKTMEPEALEFITCWLDHYALTANDTPGSIVGYVKEFKEQQKTGMSEFKLPPIP